MRIVSARRISQLFFGALLIWFGLSASVGEAWWQLRGWPINWLLQLDPLVALGSLLTTFRLHDELAWAGATVVLTIFLGRAWCGWICPLGSLNHLVSHLAWRQKRLSQKIKANQRHPGQVIKYYVLVFLLTAAAGGALSRLAHSFDALSLMARSVLAAALIALSWWVLARARGGFLRAGATTIWLVGLWLVLGLIWPVDRVVAASLQTGLLDPLPLVHRVVNLVLLPLVDAPARQLWTGQRFYQTGWLVGGLFAAMVLLNLWAPRFYCRFICPLGALLGLMGRWAVWRLGRSEANCQDGAICQAGCPGACEPHGRIRSEECVLCFNCLETCPQGRIGFRAQVSAGGETIAPDLSRRGFLVTAAAGLAALPLLRLSGPVGLGQNPRLIRPPGAAAEEEFLARCLKCSQCMRVCPSNVIQPAASEAGPEGLWSPVLNFRLGTSGCQLNCVACGQVCPSAAIRPLSLEEKLGQGRFNSAGPVRLGTAFVDRGRCLPWAFDRPCIVCQENCPLSPKAIFTRVEFVAIWDGRRTVAHSHGQKVFFRGPPLRSPSRLASGDYYARLLSALGEPPRLIIAAAADSLNLAAVEPGSWTPSPGDELEIQVRLQRPFVDPEACIGCGICEHECPVNVVPAIRVTAEGESRSRKRSLFL